MISQSDIITIWETGEGRHDADKAMIVLGCAHPEIEWDALAALPIGHRDAMMIRLHARTFGERFVIGTSCARCGEQLVFESSTDELLPADLPPVDATIRVSAGDHEVVARPLSTRDMACLSGVTDPMAARALLVGCSVVSAHGPAGIVAAADLPAPVREAVAAALTDADPLADIEFQLDCPACSHGWVITFDIARFMWREISAVAQALLDEIHDLARYLGWSQAEILALSPARRAHFLTRARA